MPIATRENLYCSAYSKSLKTHMKSQKKVRAEGLTAYVSIGPTTSASFSWSVIEVWLTPSFAG